MGECKAYSVTEEELEIMEDERKFFNRDDPDIPVIEIADCCLVCQSGVRAYTRANRTVRCVTMNKCVPLYCKCGMFARTDDKVTLGRLKGRMKVLGLI